VSAGRGAAPARPVTRIGHPGGAGAPPGTNTSPCQELADGLVCADRLLLRRVSAAAAGRKRAPDEKRGPAQEGKRRLCGAPRGARRGPSKDRGHHRIAPFGAPRPLGGARVSPKPGRFPVAVMKECVLPMRCHLLVVPGLDPGIHAVPLRQGEAPVEWIAGSSLAMTKEGEGRFFLLRYRFAP
jgi:hypothetical protein